MPEVVFASDAGGSAEGALPCLYSNNSNKEPDLEHRPEYASIYDSMKFFAFNATTRGIQH